MRCAIAALILLHLATLARAQIGLYNSEDGSALNCNNIEWSGSPHDVYVLVTGEWKSARFSIPVVQGIVPLDLQPLTGTTISGDLNNGFTLNFSESTSDRRAVARLSVIAAPFVPTCGFGLLPHPATGYVELVDCSAHAVAASWIPKVSAPGPNGDCENVGVSPLPRGPFGLAVPLPPSTSLDESENQKQDVRIDRASDQNVQQPGPNAVEQHPARRQFNCRGDKNPWKEQGHYIYASESSPQQA